MSSVLACWVTPNLMGLKGLRSYDRPPRWFSLRVSLAVVLGAAEAGVSVEGPHLHGQRPARASSLCGRWFQCRCPQARRKLSPFLASPQNPTSPRLTID